MSLFSISSLLIKCFSNKALHSFNDKSFSFKKLKTSNFSSVLTTTIDEPIFDEDDYLTYDIDEYGSIITNCFSYVIDTLKLSETSTINKGLTNIYQYEINEENRGIITDKLMELFVNDNFNNSQYKFMIDTHLQPLLKSVQDKDLLDIDNRHPVVKDALYSLSVQHGKAAQIVNNTLQKIRQNGTSFDDATLLEVLYKTRADYVKSLPASQYPGDGKITQNEKDNIINKRYPNELREALKYVSY